MALSVRARLKIASPQRLLDYFASLSWQWKLLLVSVIVVGLVAAFIRPALAATVNLTPNATISNAWTANSSCTSSGHTCIDEGTTVSTADYIGTGTALQQVSAVFDMSDPSGVGVATQITLYVHARSMGQVGTQLDAIDMNVSIGGSSLGVQNNVMTTSYAWYSVTYTGNWSQSDLETMQASFTRIVRPALSSSNDDDVRIAAVYAEVTYSTPVTTAQAAYRFYQNANNGSSSFATPTVRSFSTAGYDTVTKPSSVVAGDLLVLVYAVDTGSMSAMTVPSGFSEISATTNGTGAGHLKIATKIATGSEPASYTVGAPSDPSIRLDMFAIQDADTSVAPVVAATQTASSATTHVAPSVTPAGPNDLLLSVAAAAFPSSVPTASWTSPSGMTEVTDASPDGWITATVAQQALTGSGATGTKTFGLSSSVSVLGLTASLAIRGTGSATGPDVSAPLAARDTPAAVSSSGTPFRLRLNLGVSAAVAPVGAGVYKLQYAQRGSDNSCDTAFANESYADVATATAVRFYDNSSAIDGANMLPSANDPTRSGVTAINQSYEEAIGFSNSAAISAGQDGIWDFSLTFDASAPAGQYCFRAVRNDGSPINTYNVMPEVGIQSTVDQAAYRFYDNDATAPSSSYTTPTVRSFSTSATLTVSKPASVVAGDLLVLVFAADDGNVSAMTLPSGFTEVSATTNGFDAGHLKIATKIATGSEPVSYTTGAASGASVRLDIFSVQDADTSVAPVVMAAQTPSSSTSHVAPSVVATGANDLLLSVAMTEHAAYDIAPVWGAPSGMTEMTDSTDGWITATVARQSLSSSGATGTRTFSLANSVSRPGITASLSIQGVQSSTGVAVGTPLAARDTVATGPAVGTPFRLRLNLGATAAGLLGSSYKLQYVTRIGGSCANGVYGDITTSSPIKFYDNVTIPNGYAYNTSANDPTRGGVTAIGQTYSEANPFTVTQAIAAGQDGLWDFSLTFDSSARAADRYCIRAVTSSGAALSSYSQTAEIIVPGTAVATLEQQLRGGQTVVEGDKRKFIW